MNTETSLTLGTEKAPKRTVLNNRYTLTRRIATGGMAEIFLARQRAAESGFEKDVVIKYLREIYRQDARIQEMFRDEATIGAFLNHPNVVHAYEFGNHESMPYIAMEYIKGEELQVLARRGVEAGKFLPLEHAVDLMRQAAEGMGHFHAKRGDGGTPLEIVHRDISPSNLLVTVDGVLKIIDFGIARMRGLPGRANESDKLIPGKCNYMSPEQVRGEAVDARSDIFALGIVLYEITVGKRLFKGRPEEVIQKITRARIKPPTFVRRQFPAGLEQIVMKCLEIHPEDRYGSANDLASDLEEFLRDSRLKSGPVRIAQYLDDLRAAETASPRPELLMAGESWGDHEDGGEEPIDLDRTFLPEAPVMGRGTAPEAIVLKDAEPELELGPSETIDALREAFPQPPSYVQAESTLPPVSETDATRKMSADDLALPVVDDVADDDEILAAVAKAPWSSLSSEKSDAEEFTDIRTFTAQVAALPVPAPVSDQPTAKTEEPVLDDARRDTLPGLGILVAAAEAKVAAEAAKAEAAQAEAEPVKAEPVKVPSVVRVTPPPPPNIRVTPNPAFKLTPPPPSRKPEVVIVKPAAERARTAPPLPDEVRSTPPQKKRSALPSTPEPPLRALEPFPAPSPLPQVPPSAPPGTAEAMAEVARLLEARRQATMRPLVDLPLNPDAPVKAKAEPVTLKSEPVKAEAKVDAPSPRPAGSGRHPRGRASGRHKAPKLNFAAAAERALSSSSSATVRPEPSTVAFGGNLVDRPKQFPWVLLLVGAGLLSLILLLVLR